MGMSTRREYDLEPRDEPEDHEPETVPCPRCGAPLLITDERICAECVALVERIAKQVAREMFPEEES